MPGFWGERDELALETTTASDVAERDAIRHLVFLVHVTELELVAVSLNERFPRFETIARYTLTK